MPKRLSRYALFFIAILIILSVSYFRIFENYELATLDLRYKLRPAQPINPDIVIVEIGDDSIERIGRWPFERSWHATLLSILAHYGVKAVFFDVIFSEKQTDDGSLVASSKKLDVYYPFAFDLVNKEEKFLVASKYAAGLLDNFAKVAKGTGHINTPVDSDGKIRRIPLLIRYKEDLYPAAPLVMASDYLGFSTQDFKIPTYEKSSMLINYPAEWKDSFRHISYIDVITSYYLESQGQKGAVDLDNLKGKICFVGLTATGTHDVSPMPLENLYPGVGVHASAFNTLITKQFIVRADRGINLSIAILLALLMVAVSLRLRPLVSLGLATSSAVAFITITFLSFAFFRIWIDLIFPVILITSVYLYSTFYRYNTERRKRELMEKELTIAASIQQSFLPDRIPEAEGLEIAANMLTTHHVGGDLYDFVDYKDGTLGIMIGDVSGKGVPAALFMAKVATEFRIFSKDKKEPSRILKSLNEELLQTSKTNLFVTMSYVFIDPANKRLTYASGGHLPMILIRGNGYQLLSAEEGLALGMFQSNFSDEKVGLSKGDILVLYTDGVTEAANTKGQEFGTDRLANVITKNKHLDCKRIINMVYSEVRKFAGKAPQRDDITVIIIKVL